MSSELTNLLPEERERALRREYRFRLGTLAALILTLAIAIHAALLLPSYLYLADAVDLQDAHLSGIAADLASSEEASMNARLAALDADAGRLLTLSSSTSATGVIKAILAVPHLGITLTGFSYSAPAPSGRLTLTGSAATRESLRQFAAALAALPYVTKADLPLSAYAKESDIAFTITLTGPLAPPAPLP